MNPSNSPQTPDPGTTDPAREADPQSLQEPTSGFTVTVRGPQDKDIEARRRADRKYFLSEPDR